MPTLQSLMALATFALLTACAPQSQNPTPTEARAAMTARMERSTAAKVKVTEMRELTLNDCAPAPSLPGVICAVQMDVVFTVDGESNHSNDSDRLRFVREPSGWVAYPL